MLEKSSILVTGGTGSFGKAFILKTIEKYSPKRIVVFSGGNAKSTEDILAEIKQIKNGGGNGSIIGRNTFQRPRLEALEMLNKIIEIYKN